MGNNQNNEGAKYFSVGLGAAKKKDYENARKLYEKAASFKHAGAINNLAVLYMKGRGVVKDLKKAFELFLEAANLGSAVAMRNVGECYRDGNGTDKNIEEYIKWHTKGAESGDAKCMFSMGEYYGKKTDHQNIEKAVKYYNEAAKNGDCKMKLEVAKKLDTQSYYDTSEALDLAKASYWFKEAVNGDDDEIKFLAAKEMEDKYNSNGDLIRPAIDLSVSFNAYKFVAETGNKEACKEVAYCFEIGKGTQKSIDSAILFYEKGKWQERADWCKKKKSGKLSDVEFENHMEYKMPDIPMNVHACNKELYKCRRSIDFKFGQYDNMIYYINSDNNLCSSTVEGADIKKLAELDESFASYEVFLQVNETGIYLYSTHDYPKLKLRRYGFDGILKNEYYINKRKEYSDDEWFSDVYVYDSKIYYLHNIKGKKPSIECVDMEDLSLKKIYNKATEITKLCANKENVIFYAEFVNEKKDNLSNDGWLAVNVSSLEVDCISNPYCNIENVFDNPEYYDRDSKKHNEKCYFDRHIEYVDLNRNIMWTKRIVKEGVDSAHLKDVIYLEPKELFGDRDKVINNLPIWKTTKSFMEPEREYFDGKYNYKALNYYTLISTDLMNNNYSVSGNNGGHGICEEFVVLGNYMYVDRAANYYLEQCKLDVKKLDVVKKAWFDEK